MECLIVDFHTNDVLSQFSHLVPLSVCENQRKRRRKRKEKEKEKAIQRLAVTVPGTISIAPGDKNSYRADSAQPNEKKEPKAAITIINHNHDR